MAAVSLGSTLLVCGASGGLGAALLRAGTEKGAFEHRVGAARRPAAIDAQDATVRVPFDLESEGSLAELVGALPPSLRVAICATGLLHDAAMRPEKTIRALDPEQMARSFRINTIGPALLAKHLLPAFPRAGRAILAIIAARVGSIGDNRSGGWYAYRASKAALAMVIRCLSIEAARTHPDLICVGLHPGTVATPLSAPFRSGVAPDRLFPPDDAARRLWMVIDGLEPWHSGAVLDWKGEIVPP